MVQIYGVSEIMNWHDLIIRTSMLFPDCGFEAYHEKFNENICEVFPQNVRDAWLASVNSIGAIDCIKKFAVVEANISTDSKKGLGRVSVEAFPRLGGVLHKFLKNSNLDLSVIQFSIERTLHASYLVTLLILKGIREKKRILDANVLWEKWIPASYNHITELSEQIDSFIAYGAYWSKVFNLIGFHKLEKMLNTTQSDITRSIGGLSMVGYNLALAERET